MAALFSTLIYQPILNAFVFLYTYIPDVGIVIFLLTLAVRLILFPLTKQSIAAQKSMTDLQPKMEALKATYKNDQQALARETMNLYKEHKVNPFGSCLPLLLQIPIFLGLFYVLRDIFSVETLPPLYSFIQNPGTISPISLGFLI